MNIICIYRKIIDFFKKEFFDFSPNERIFFLLVFILIVFLSLYMKDSKLALVSAVCGISYSILNGKGKIYCYFFGITGTLIYSYLSYRNGFWGNFILYFFYYFPMEITGILNWKKYLKKSEFNIIKTKLTRKGRIVLVLTSVVLPVLILFITNIFSISKIGYLDFMCLFLSVTGMVLTVKRCYEQWYIWTIVNIISFIIWFSAYLNGANCFALVLMWLVYLALGIYFLFKWKKELAL